MAADANLEAMRALSGMGPLGAAIAFVLFFCLPTALFIVLLSRTAKKMYAQAGGNPAIMVISAAMFIAGAGTISITGGFLMPEGLLATAMMGILASAGFVLCFLLVCAAGAAINGAPRPEKK